MADQPSERILWFAAGCALGAAIALLYAPMTGEDMRKQIADKASDGSASFTDVGKDLIERGRDLYEKGRQIADDAAEMFDQGRKIVQGSGPKPA